MLKEDNKMLKYNHGENPMKILFIIYSDLECLLKKMSTCHNNPEKLSTTKINENTTSGYSFDATKSKLDSYRDKDCVERFCKDLKQHTTKVINYEKKEMIPLNDEKNKSYKKQKVCYICKKRFSTDGDDNKTYHNVRDHCYYTGKYRRTVHCINVRYKTPRQIPVVFYNGSTYDYHFIIEELVKRFEGQFEYLGRNTKKYITFSVPIKKELGNGETIICELNFIDSLYIHKKYIQILQ